MREAFDVHKEKEWRDFAQRKCRMWEEHGVCDTPEEQTEYCWICHDPGNASGYCTFENCPTRKRAKMVIA